MPAAPGGRTRTMTPTMVAMSPMAAMTSMAPTAYGASFMPGSSFTPGRYLPTSAMHGGASWRLSSKPSNDAATS